MTNFNFIPKSKHLWIQDGMSKCNTKCVTCGLVKRVFDKKQHFYRNNVEVENTGCIEKTKQ